MHVARRSRETVVSTSSPTSEDTNNSKGNLHQLQSEVMATHFAPENAALTSFCGYVRVGSEELKVRVRGITYGAGTGRISFDRAQLDVEPPLAKILAAQQDTLKIRLMQSSSLESFVRELEELVAICAPAQNLQPSLPSAAYYTRLMEELDAIGWDRLLELSDDLSSLELETVDAAKRKHAIRLQLSAEYPTTEPPVCFVDAPEPFELVWEQAAALPPSDAYMLKEVLQQFDAFIAKYQSFWDVLDDLDAKTCVLEPHRPTRATGRRRIALEKHASVQIEVDPSRPRAICELSFFGNDATVAPLREKWSEFVFQWDEALPLRENLANILDVEFPSPKHVKTEEFAVECGICYCYRLEVGDSADNEDQEATGVSVQVTTGAVAKTIIPDKLCENGKCNRPFHEKCLFDWLKALPTARQSFNTVFGECPYCREAISAKFLP